MTALRSPGVSMLQQSALMSSRTTVSSGSQRPTWTLAAHSPPGRGLTAGAQPWTCHARKASPLPATFPTGSATSLSGMRPSAPRPWADRPGPSWAAFRSIGAGWRKGFEDRGAAAGGRTAYLAAIPLMMAMAASNTSSRATNGQDVLIFTTPGCPYCRTAKKILSDANVAFDEVDVGSNSQLLSSLMSASGMKTVPQIFIQGALVGGCDDLEEVVRKGELQALLNRPTQPLPPQLETALTVTAVGSKAPPKGGPAKEPAAGGDSEQQLSELAEKIRKAVESGDLPTAPSSRSFTGVSLVDWLQRNQGDAKEAGAAVALGLSLQRSLRLHHETFSEPFPGDKPSSLFRLHVHEPPPLPAADRSLNMAATWVKPTRPASQVAEGIRAAVLELYSLALSPDGKSVKYSSLRDSEAFRRYVESTGELQRVDLYSLTPDEKKAFFINVYNSLIIHALIAKGPPANFLARLLFYKSIKYHIGGHDYSADDIENGVLRGNRVPPSNFWGSRCFDAADPRRFHSLCSPMDARIHAALNCGAKSCPPIRVFSPENIEVGLDAAASNFCGSEVEVLEDGTILLSKIFSWYAVDFGSTPEERVAWLLPYVTKDTRIALESILAKGPGSIKLAYREYDWGLND
eukprot:jgi/Mesvir1/6229/Mv00907-RA.1